MAKYENDVKQLLKLIGGKENIQAGFTLYDKNAFRLVIRRRQMKRPLRRFRQSREPSHRQDSIKLSLVMMCPCFTMNLLPMLGLRE